MNKHSESKHTEAVLILLVLTLFALGFVGIPVILYLTALLLLVYWTDSSAFFGLLVFAFVVYLGGFYYQLSIPLLYKGVLLVALPLFLRLLLYSCMHVIKRLHKVRSKTILFLKHRFGLLASL